MPLQVASPVKPGSWPITVGAAGIAAAQFARCGFDVMMQAGPDKPWYDLVVTKAGNLLKIGVKATEDGCWRLAESYLLRAAHANPKKTRYSARHPHVARYARGAHRVLPGAV